MYVYSSAKLYLCLNNVIQSYASAHEKKADQYLDPQFDKNNKNTYAWYV